jgi:hypothetical protein
MMLMKDERRCGFGICLPHLVIYSHFGDFVNFGCHVQAWQLVEPTQAFSPQFMYRSLKLAWWMFCLAILRIY